ncbi:MAG: carboxymuconolactone decarboxylase family protein [Syntrophobacterales bacterium]|nr:carboxymuconolactone decarboxylase family protein [Syntrophobacterales bacterium]
MDQKKSNGGAFIEAPTNIPWYLKIGLWAAKKSTGKEMLPGLLLAWFPKAAIGSGFLEFLTAHGPKDMERRLLKIVRTRASALISCPFCLDMNSYDYPDHGLTKEEAEALSQKTGWDVIASFSRRERIALRYAEGISRTPPDFSQELRAEIRLHFSEREIVIMAATVAQVNYWARLLGALAVPSAGFCELNNQKPTA